MNDISVIGLDAVVWAGWGLVTGYAAHRLPARVLDHDTWLTRTRPWEAQVSRRLRVRRWQRLLPEAGRVFGGRSKRRVGGRGSPTLERYAAETRRAEVVHWLGFVPLIAFLFWNPAPLWLVMAAYATAANVPCVLSLRANRARIGRVLRRRGA